MVRGLIARRESSVIYNLVGGSMLKGPGSRLYV